MAVKKASAVTTNPPRRRKPSAFISAPATVDTSSLVSAVRNRGIEAIRIEELAPGSNFSDLLRESMRHADFVIAVIGETPNANVWYELGIASGMGKPVLLLASPRGVIPPAASGLSYLKTDPDNQVAIEFGLDQLLATPRTRTIPRLRGGRETHPIGASADRLLHSLNRLREDGSVREHDVVNIIYEAIRQSGASTLSESGVSTLSDRAASGRTRVADLAVWSGDFEPLIGNPLIIEVKESLKGRGDVETAIKRVGAMLDETRSPCGLLLYLEAKPIVLYGGLYDPRVMVMSVEEFLMGLRGAGLGSVSK